MSYIVNSDNRLIAKTDREIKSGTIVEYAYDTSKEAIDASRDFNLVNSRTGKISNDKKWDIYSTCVDVDSSTEINGDGSLEFLILK